MERTESRTEVNIGFGKGRIESLTDGIFAFGMTLLVLGAGYPFTVATLAKTPAHDILVNSVPDVILYIYLVPPPRRVLGGPPQPVPPYPGHLP